MKFRRSIIMVLSAVVLCGGCSTTKDENDDVVAIQEEHVVSASAMTSNALSDFDLAILKLHEGEENVVYSPISLKYVLAMLHDAADGDTKKEIENLLGNYVAQRYENDEHISFANGMFIRNSDKDTIQTSYMDLIKKNYDADVVFDDFQSPDTINAWISEKTKDLIPEAVKEIKKTTQFYLVNALAIDMKWKNRFMDPNETSWTYGYDHLTGVWCVVPQCSDCEFNGDYRTQIIGVGGAFNKYDLVSDLGEENIRKEIKEAYEAWLEEYKEDIEEYEVDVKPVGQLVDEYIRDLKANYLMHDQTTDFSYNETDKEIVLIKDLEEDQGLELEYVAIQPKSDSLEEYVDSLSVDKINELITTSKEASIEAAEDGYITVITGSVPVFNYSYEMNIVEDLQRLGIKEAFDPQKANLSRLATDQKYIEGGQQNVTISFTNEGITAGAVTVMAGGMGADWLEFQYYFDVSDKVKNVELYFEKPFFYLIRDKKTNEIWFMGKMYEPSKALSYDEIVEMLENE